ncbi:DUF397 domain-containing protein [Micromonospora sp. WMMD1128]|uniref:DUF397 domain-containing protein n=1 Tax=Micromonospora sp. WMMD1128 TaxID=3015150 RepID=UPI00248C97C2|nr:DUF397 domain-containing protein [Micromonospora sp. WMMD1128]WBB75086.1 DUF397 domain-containing protein [Micromonospora sp. WMMD1128]
MDETNQDAVTWRKSTRSNGSGNCVEVADNLSGHVGVRDSKDASGPVLLFDGQAWQSFLRGFQQEHAVD